MSVHSVSAVLAIFYGAFFLPLLFIPYVAWSYRHRGRLGYGHALIVAGAVIYAMALWTYTILPLPDAASMDCSSGGVAPRFVPFGSFEKVDWAANGWRDSMLLQIIFNVVFFIPFGMLGRHLASRVKPVWIIVAGAGMSLLIELTQLTGVWGLYPCAYRLFDVDDLLANTLGAAIGVGLAPLLRFIPGQEASPPGQSATVTRSRRLLGMAIDYVSVVAVSFAVYLLLVVAAREAGWVPLDASYSHLYGWSTLVVGTLILLAVPWVSRGATLGQLITFVRPISGDGQAPTRSAILRRWATGAGGYFVLLGLASITDQQALSLLANAWLVVAAVMVIAVHPRGISGYASGLTVADARDPSLVASRAIEADPRSLSHAVVLFVTAGYILFAVLVAVSALAPAVGTGMSILGIVALALATATLIPTLTWAGVVTAKREGVNLSSILPLLAAGGLIGLLVLLIIAAVAGIPWLLAATLGVTAVTGYLGFLFIAFVLYGWWYAHRPAKLPANAVLILGSRVFGDRVPPLLASRIDKGISVFHKARETFPDSNPVLVCSGGQGPDETMPEGEAMAAYTIKQGVPETQVLAETASRNTEENLTLSRALLDEQGIGPDIIVVTSDYHAFRAGIIAKELGMKAQVVGAPTAHYYFPSAVIREYVGVLARSKWLHALVALALATGVAGLAWLVVG